jgi:CRISPR-associated protein Csm3
MHIGGTDNPVIKNPITLRPYIPGSSIKGKVRSMLEWYIGVVGITGGSPLGFKHIKDIGDEKVKEEAKKILKLFGSSADTNIPVQLLSDIGPTRLSFWDCELKPDSDWMKKTDGLFTETKMENSIDRIKGTAENPRNTERVIAGAIFDFKLSVRVHDGEDLMSTIWQGLKLLEITGLGGSLSRGYGKIRFNRLMCGDQDMQNTFDSTAIK